METGTDLYTNDEKHPIQDEIGKQSIDKLTYKFLDARDIQKLTPESVASDVKRCQRRIAGYLNRFCPAFSIEGDKLQRVIQIEFREYLKVMHSLCKERDEAVMLLKDLYEEDLRKAKTIDTLKVDIELLRNNEKRLLAMKEARSLYDNTATKDLHFGVNDRPRPITLLQQDSTSPIKSIEDDVAEVEPLLDLEEVKKQAKKEWKEIRAENEKRMKTNDCIMPIFDHRKKYLQNHTLKLQKRQQEKVKETESKSIVKDDESLKTDVENVEQIERKHEEEVGEESTLSMVDKNERKALLSFSDTPKEATRIPLFNTNNFFMAAEQENKDGANQTTKHDADNSSQHHFTSLWNNPMKQNIDIPIRSALLSHYHHLATRFDDTARTDTTAHHD
eukprot:g2279.t1